MSYKPLPEPEDEAGLMEFANRPVLIVGPEWLHADVAMFDTEDFLWYSPVDGSEFFPPPTHYMEIPKL